MNSEEVGVKVVFRLTAGAGDRTGQAQRAPGSAGEAPTQTPISWAEIPATHDRFAFGDGDSNRHARLGVPTSDVALVAAVLSSRLHGRSGAVAESVAH